ncbi:dTDP-4-dehydrorhamnose reductase [Methanospirillum hungatei]|uniref:dTDP-4-dehydrorhamnose reductase n=1 Tax=Methanospirillum hungatei TaxID=2203 RepID=UPI0026ED13A6|nr:dTDP-4-dehydrorhamnose reductase [Methanospirillum hungatei]MCA1914834.1 dTDP-4-dehydrorhamnose reductase [Methanospirillum hungatei]
MKVVITGANGQLGQDITNLLRKHGHDVTACGSKDLDITKYDRVTETIQTHKPDIIINCAAYNAVDLAETEWEKAFLVNGIGPKNLSLAANKVNAAFVHYSTDYVFNGKASRPYTIADHPDPISRYGESKLLGEQQVMRHATRSYLIRVSWVFGSGNINFVKKVLEWSDKSDSITVVDDQVASPTYTKDLAKATLDLIQTDQYGLYHCTNTGHCSRLDFAAYILQQIGWSGELIPGKSTDFKTPATRPGFSVLDNFGLKQVIGYSLPSWQDATERFLKEIGRT